MISSFWPAKKKPKKNFFTHFNTLYQNNKQIVISSDRPPKAISTLEERLKSRFEGGMIADISYAGSGIKNCYFKSQGERKKL